MDYDAYDAILQHIYIETQSDTWLKAPEENVATGVCVRVDAGIFRVFPYENPYLEPFENAINVLNPAVAVKIRNAAVHAAFATCTDEKQTQLPLDSETQIQIIDSIGDLVSAEKEQCGAFIRDERMLIVWADDVDSIVPLYKEFEEKMIRLLWRTRPVLSPSSRSSSYSNIGSPSPSMYGGSRANSMMLESPRSRTMSMRTEKESPLSQPPMTPESKEKDALEEAAVAVLAQREKTPDRRGGFSIPFWSAKKKEGDAESARPESRPMRLYAPFYAGAAVGLSVLFIGTGASILLAEVRYAGMPMRFILLLAAPLLFCVSLFFSLQLIVNLSFCIGPVAQFHENSKYYSAVKPAANKAVDSALPHVTIEMPVYKESLEQTIAPSVYSLKKAMQTYARQGGTSAIFVHDDGMQLISEEEREKRIKFYSDHNIGWVARPGHSSSPDGFKRAGRFKKASNMNAGLLLSMRMEHYLAKLESGEIDPNPVEGDYLEDKAMTLAIDEAYEASGKRWKMWARNAKSCRIGDIILIIDSDTVVPEDCLRDAARELAECPEVAIIQHESDVMQVAHHYFENGIAHFTRRINKCISLDCSNGGVAPFVGHNAFLRWSAIQDAAFVDDADGVKKIWSESNVSEDFDMALRLQLKGYTIRWATYSNGGFKEGVSLTADDELNRWQKYAYGCNELIFNPIVRWWKDGPINKQLRTFIWSGAPVHYKVCMMAYMFSYYGIACGFILSFVNYFLLGWAFRIDGYYTHSFEIWLACIAVFPVLGNIAFTLAEYRLGQRSLWASFIENVTWVPFFLFFFSGISIHISTALLAHCFSYDITWGATKKEVERSNFFQEVPIILKRFWIAFLMSFAAIGAIVVTTAGILPLGWQIDGANWSVWLPTVVVCIGHILYPIVLNPYMMVFSY